MTELEELMASYGLDPSNPDNMDELLYRINNENDTFEDDSDLESLLAEYSDVNEFYNEYRNNDSEDAEWID
tara:strand:- start:37699 stop:37911 length:213 start_codon:yes stop_codon:yes gene_type:complete